MVFEPREINLAIRNPHETALGIIVRELLAQKAYESTGSRSNATSVSRAPRERTSCFPSGDKAKEKICSGVLKSVNGVGAPPLSGCRQRFQRPARCPA